MQKGDWLICNGTAWFLIDVGGAGVEEAPLDGELYGRQAGAWEIVPAAAGLPPGGATDEILTKASPADGDAVWAPIPAGLPPGGTIGQILAKVTAANFDAIWEDNVSASSIQLLVDDITIPNSAAISIVLHIQDTSVLVNQDGSIKQACVYVSNYTAPQNFGYGQYCYPRSVIDSSHLEVGPWGNQSWPTYGEPTGTVIRGGTNYVTLSPHPAPTTSALIQQAGSTFTVPANGAAGTLYVRANYAYRPFAGQGICFCLRNNSPVQAPIYFRVVSIQPNQGISIRCWQDDNWDRFGAPPGTTFGSGLVYPCDPPTGGIEEAPLDGELYGRKRSGLGDYHGWRRTASD
jgi:hypothetical protein